MEYSEYGLSDREAISVDVDTLNYTHLGDYGVTNDGDRLPAMIASNNARNDLAKAKYSGSVSNWAAERYRSLNYSSPILEADGCLYGKAATLYGVKLLAKCPPTWIDEYCGADDNMDMTSDGAEMIVDEIEALRAQCQATGQSLAQIGNRQLDGITDRAVDKQFQMYQQKRLQSSRNKGSTQSQPSNGQPMLVERMSQMSQAEQAQHMLSSMFGENASIPNSAGRKLDVSSDTNQPVRNMEGRVADKAKSASSVIREAESGLSPELTKDRQMQLDETTRLLKFGGQSNFDVSKMGPAMSDTELLNRHLVQQFACTQQYEPGGPVEQKWPGLDKLSAKDLFPYWYSKSDAAAYYGDNNVAMSEFASALTSCTNTKFPDFAMKIKSAPSYEAAMQECQPFAQRAMTQYERQRHKVGYEQIADAVVDEFANEPVGQRQLSSGKTETISRKQDYYHNLAKRMADPKRNAGLNQLDMPSVDGYGFYR